MLQNVKIRCFIQLGEFLSQFKFGLITKKEAVLFNDSYFQEFEQLIENLQNKNGWFTPEQVYFAIESWSEALTEENLNYWLSNYTISEKPSKKIGLILAGNIPLVGFHDFLCVLISGNKALIKNSSNDDDLLPFIANYLISLDASFKEYITFTSDKLEHFDAVIATGSNNTARYFEFYFKDKPNIIRKNRNSVAVLSGNETKEELIKLGEDIFRYFGLGCRNVSKLFIPKAYNFDLFFNAMYEYKEIINYKKYENNYDYNKAVYLMSLFKILDNGFLTIKEDSSYSSPISSVFYEYYSSIEDIKNKLIQDQELIQCVVSNELIDNSIPFGQTQKPKLWDYADNVDTLQFLIEL